jgi:hypothetical protein
MDRGDPAAGDVEADDVDDPALRVERPGTTLPGPETSSGRPGQSRTIWPGAASSPDAGAWSAFGS